MQPVAHAAGVSAFAARSLVEVWAAAETLAGHTLDSPFWAFPWPGGIALAALVRERPDLVRGRSVIDVGAGGGVASFACALSGAASVVACDTDAWALAVTRIAALRQQLDVETLCADAAADPEILDRFDVVLCGDLAYTRSAAPAERAALHHAHARGATVLVADGGRMYFDPYGLELLAEYEIQVVADLEGCERRVGRVYRLVQG